MIKIKVMLVALAATLVAVALPSSARAVEECPTATCISGFQECSAEIVSAFTDCIALTTKLEESTAECFTFLTEAGLENQGDFRECLDEDECVHKCPAEIPCINSANSVC